MQQRVMIAAVLACKPKLLIADEPTSSLDVTIQAQVLDLFRQLPEKTGVSVLFITHDFGVVAQIARFRRRNVRGRNSGKGKCGRHIRPSATCLFSPTDRFRQGKSAVIRKNETDV